MSTVRVQAAIRYKLLGSFDNSKNSKTQIFSKKIRVAVNLSRKRLRENIARNTTSAEVSSSVKAGGVFKLINLECSASASTQSMEYRQLTTSLQEESQIVTSEETTVTANIGPGCSMDVYAVVVDGPAGLMQSEATITVPKGDTPHVEVFHLVYNVEVQCFGLLRKRVVLQNRWKGAGDYLGYEDSSSKMRVGYRRQLAVPFEIWPAEEPDTVFLESQWNGAKSWVGYRDSDGCLKVGYGKKHRVPWKLVPTGTKNEYFLVNRWNSGTDFVGYKDSGGWAHIGYQKSLRVPFRFEIA